MLHTFTRSLRNVGAAQQPAAAKCAAADRIGNDGNGDERDPGRGGAMTREPRPQSDPAAERPDLRALLGESQLATLGRYGKEHRVADGDVLFADGDRSYDMIVVLEGTVEIIEHHGRADERVIISYGPREFLGEMGLLTGQTVYLSAVATSERPGAPRPPRAGEGRHVL